MPNAAADFKIDPAIIAAARAEGARRGVERAEADQEAWVAAWRCRHRSLPRACAAARAAVKRLSLGRGGDALSRASVRPPDDEAWDAMPIAAEAEEETQGRVQGIIDLHADQLARQGIEGRILALAIRGFDTDEIAGKVRRTPRRVRQVIAEALAGNRAPGGQEELFAGVAAC